MLEGEMQHLNKTGMESFDALDKHGFRDIEGTAYE